MFIHPLTWSFYTASVLVGVAAAGTADAPPPPFFLFLLFL